MVRLHVLDDQIVRLTVTQSVADILKPFVGKILIHRIHDGNLLVHDGIGVIGHAVGDNILALEQVYLMVVYTDVLDIIGNGHKLSPCLFALAILYPIFPNMYSDNIT